jgi:hypothetical protein
VGSPGSKGLHLFEVGQIHRRLQAVTLDVAPNTTAPADVDLVLAQ